MKIPGSLLVLLTMLVCAVPATAEQDKLILTSVRDTTKDTLAVALTEDPRGLRALRVSLPSGGNIGQTPERIRAEDVAVQAFSDTGVEFALTPLVKTGPIPGVCNAGSCNAIAHYRFAVANAALDQLQRVIVVFKGKRYEMTLARAATR
jgi:hypothetical protein